MPKENISPAMRKYLEIKEKYPDCILLYRLGDFYEMFFDDAIKASKALDLILTQKACGMSEKAPMCGVPYHAAKTYIARLVASGFKVAICEQLTQPVKGVNKILERDVVRVITPGTLIDDEMLDGQFKDTDIYIRYKKGCNGVTFFDTSYLIRVIHLVFALYGELLDGGYHLRLSAFGSHVAENMIGKIRISCHGNHKFEVIMRVVSRSEVRRLLQWELGIEHTVRGRDNTGGTKLEAGIPTDLDGLDFADLGHTIVQALREGADPPNDAFQQIALFCSKVLDRQRKVYHIYCYFIAK